MTQTAAAPSKKTRPLFQYVGPPLWPMLYAVEMVRAGALEIDNEGRVWRRKVCHFDRHSGRRRWHAVPRRRAEHAKRKGYLSIPVCVGGVLRCVAAHRLVWEVLRGPIPAGLEIDHKDLDKTNNAIGNLEPVTGLENMRRSHASGKRARPYTHTSIWRGRPIRLARSRDREIIRARGRGDKIREVAARYGVSMSYISYVCRGRSWQR